MTPRWLPLESNPDVMNEYLSKLGVPASSKSAFVDVWGLDAEALQFIPRPVHALLLLFPVDAVAKGDPIGTVVETGSDGTAVMPFYTKQTIANACGTIALVHALANAGIDLGSGPIHRIVTRLAPLTPMERAKALETDTELSTLHEESSLEGQTDAPPLEDEVDLHFIAFVHVGGKVWELDGSKAGPVLHGDAADNDAFVTAAAGVVQKFMARDPDATRFTVVALAAQEE
ncbi:Ubiquitin carboxyl-terminal hydrolase isozyme L3 [Chytriomyces hyalinus]|uniref:Ubiquitin carboxyl-terminal hydrolase n=1 Tax=Chytriomyces confervae TaxID=246404 RepID=A0A507DL94_9FUNG|nr:Ubiquitin carboxyl-terminal hydrolase isozyme L3 [Chytriomyces hyalinus]TPX52025.1 hypothetical protein CcCBS67573_g09958 [Chytriomyces confervae]